MRKVVIGTPYRDEFTVRYMNGMVAAMTDSALARDYRFIPVVTTSAYVQIARNEIANKAIRDGADDVVFIDADIGWTPEHLDVLLGHDVDIVGADYCKRVAGEPQGCARAVPGTKPREDGLQEATCLPGGFLRIRTKVFKAMAELLPQRHYRHDGKPVACEYFPVALTEKNGWRHPAEVKLDLVRSILESDWPDVDKIFDVVNSPPAELPEIAGEDVAFCRLAAECGFTVWCDVSIKLRHYGMVGFPAVETPL